MKKHAGSTQIKGRGTTSSRPKPQINPESSDSRIQKVIASSGYCSRRKAEDLILQGRVTVNGRKVEKMGVRVDPNEDIIKVDGSVIRPPKKSSFLYFVLNKPSGYITSLHDPEGRQTVMELLPPMARRLRPVGRLDYNTEGILLFTDDGELLHRLTHPSYGVRRRYLVRAKGIIDESKLIKLKTSGIFLDGAKIKNIDISDIRHTDNSTWFEIEIGEGRNREIRRIVLALGAEVSRLKRIAYGAVFKGIPPKGLFRPLSKQEVKDLYAMVGME